MKSNGTWNMVVFAGDASSVAQMGRIHALAKQLAELRDATFGVLETILVHCAKWERVELAEFPSLFRPSNSVTGRDYTKIYIDERSVYDEVGVDRNNGGLVLVRPDRYIVWTGGLGNIGDLRSYLTAVFSLSP
jgi:phenol 2-monooxygenase